MTPTLPTKRLPRKRRWVAARGGNRLDRLHQALVGDRNHVESLSEDSPRRRPTLPTLRFMGKMEALQTAISAAAVPTLVPAAATAVVPS